MARRQSGGIKNIAVTSEDVRPEIANSKAVEVKRQTDGPEEMSTSARLFPDLMEDKGEARSLPIAQGPEDEPGPETPPSENPPAEVPAPQEPEVAPEEPARTEEPEPAAEPPKVQEGDYLDLDKFGNKKIRTKIDGVEDEVTLKELRDRHQLKVHLNQAADKVGEERRKLAEERRRLEELRQQQNYQFNGGMQNNVVPDQMNGIIPDVPRGTIPSDPIRAEIEALKQQFNQYMEGTRPIVYQSNRQKVSDELRAQGFDDFLDYLPKMESHIITVQNPNLQSFYDTPEGAKALYFQLKAQDMKSAPVSARPVSVPVQNSSPARPPIMRIDSGSQPSGGIDDSGYDYRQTFRKAVALGDDKEAWNNVLRKKGIISDD